MYGEGRGVQQNHAEALKWLRQAADQRVAPAMATLGDSYRLARGVARDLVLAHMWFNLAVRNARGSEPETRMAERRDEIERQLNPSQLAQARLMAEQWRPTTVAPANPGQSRTP
jgi:TPR repeat protein